LRSCDLNAKVFERLASFQAQQPHPAHHQLQHQLQQHQQQQQQQVSILLVTILVEFFG
jgi:hypothetical protein